MARTKIKTENGWKYTDNLTSDAEFVSYDNTTSGLEERMCKMQQMNNPLYQTNNLNFTISNRMMNKTE